MDVNASDYDSTPLHHNYTLSYENQVLQWYDYGRPVLRPFPDKSLVASWIGINDISDSSKYKFPIDNATNFASLYQEMITTQFDALEKVYDAGYRNFLFLNLPPLENTVCHNLSPSIASCYLDFLWSFSLI
jgi:hypothetical protein